ncbi:AAA family ATPase [Peptoniphilus equinus]|uniref:Nuclease SbcCD subunit C n=1 Tax=Peptoniphilus equinus TaxID=3016343 RepID=A0ABY7QV74_9FIRM|nr:AAA family ATPase [Peptoniphilus equinus]WBW50692.1 AAA family ATPase [Peptoniphilus equinus]
MIYITKIEIDNFQSHKHTVMDFHHGLNVIVGRSDSGKTAVLRAIKWVLYNDPAPSSLLRLQETQMKVSLSFSNGAKVTRLWSSNGKENKYILNRADGEELVLEKFNRGVPDEVIEEIGISKIDLGGPKSEGINIGEQLDGPFLLTETPSTRASAIGRLIGVNFIDDALRDVIKDIKGNSRRIKDQDDLVAHFKEELRNFESLDEEIKNLERIKAKREQLAKSTSLYQELKQLKTAYETNIHDIDMTEEAIAKMGDIDMVDSKINRVSQCLERKTELTQLYRVLHSVSEELVHLSNQLRHLKNLGKTELTWYKLNEEARTVGDLTLLKMNLDQVNERLSIGENYLKKFETLESTRSVLKTTETKIKTLTELKTLHDAITLLCDALQTEEERYLLQVRELSDTEENYENLFVALGYCPLCHSKITQDHFHGGQYE